MLVSMNTPLACFACDALAFRGLLKRRKTPARPEQPIVMRGESGIGPVPPVARPFISDFALPLLDPADEGIFISF